MCINGSSPNHLKQKYEKLILQAERFKRLQTEEFKQKIEFLKQQADDFKRQQANGIKYRVDNFYFAAKDFQSRHTISWEKYTWSKLNIFQYRGINTRVDVDTFWARTKIYWRNREIYKINPFGVVTNFLKDVKLNSIFLYYLFIKKVRHGTQLDHI